MHAWEVIQGTIDHIETHLTDALNIDDLAELARIIAVLLSALVYPAG